MHFEDLSNEVILCIWDQLLEADVIFSFCNLNNRITSLLYRYCGLFTKLDLRYCSLSAFRYLCRQVPNTIEWRLGLTVLKLGNRYRCSQLHMFTNEIANLFRLGETKQYNDIPNDFSHPLTMNAKRLQPLFPQLVSFAVFQTTHVSDECIDILLYAMAGGLTMHTFTWRACGKQTHHSKAFFDWLFQYSRNLHSYQLTTRLSQDCFELTYEHTRINGYIPHHSLIHLQISVVNIVTLYTLLHYLPQLQHLDVHIQKRISLTDITDQLPARLNHPKDLRTLKIKNFEIVGQALNLLEDFIQKFSKTLEVLSFFTYHKCDGDFNLCFNGHRLANLCGKLSQLRKLSFAMEVHLIEKADYDLISKFTKTFSTPFWLDGPLGRTEVCVDYNSVWNTIQAFSLPYILSEQALIHTVDLVNVQFNTPEKDTRRIPIDLTSLWCNMKRLLLIFDENQQIPLTFLRALQCPFGHQNKTLTLHPERGILPNNVENDVQLLHFTGLIIKDSNRDNFNYNIQNLLSWLRLLPNIDRLHVELTEFKHWLTNDLNNQHLDFFLQRLDRLFIDCPCIINREMNDEIMKPLLLFIINKDRFPRLRCLRFTSCKNISSSWININQWIDFILHRVTEHQLTCVRFDFAEKEQEILGLQTSDELIMTTEPSCIVDVHRFVWSDHVTLWLERRQK